MVMFFVEKVVKEMQWKWKNIFKNMLENQASICNEITFNLNLKLYTKINSKYIIDINVQYKTKIVLQENIGKIIEN